MAGGLRGRAVLRVLSVRGDLQTHCHAGDLVPSIRVRYPRVYVCRPPDHVGVSRRQVPGARPVHARRTGHGVRQRARRDICEMFGESALRSKVSAQRI